MKLKHVIAGLLLVVGAYAHADTDSVRGIWQTQPGDTGGVLHIEINHCDNKLCGIIVKAVDKHGQASSNYQHLGKTMIWDMQSQADGAYGDGKIWAPDKNKTYKSKMQLDGDTLTVKGCVAGGWICRGQDWTRVDG